MNKNIIKISLFLALMFLPFYFIKFNILGIGFNIVEIFILICALFTVIDQVGMKKIQIGNYWVYIFLLLSFVSVFFANDKIGALGIFKGWFLIPVMVYFCVINFKQKYEFLAWPLVINLFLVLIIAIGQKLHIIDTVFYQHSLKSAFEQYLGSNLRVFGPFDSPNFLAMYLVPIIFLILALSRQIKDKKLSIISWVLMVWAICVLYWTKSAGGSLALTCAIIFILISAQIKDKKIQKITLSAFCVILLVGIFYGINNDPIRRDLMHYTWILITQNPILGIGLGDFQSRLNMLDLSNSFRQFGYPYALHPHNLFLAQWLNLGILGLLVFTKILLDFFKTNFKQNSLPIIFLTAAMVAILVHGLVDTTYYKNDLAIIFWLIIALSFNLKDEKRETA